MCAATNDGNIYTKEQQDEILKLPYYHIKKHEEASTYRVTLLMGCNYWLNIPNTKLLMISDILDTLHNSGLIIDDVCDGSTIRRGVPAAHEIYGMPCTISSGLYGLFVGLMKTFKLNKMETIEICLEQMISIAAGEGIEIYWREHNICPSENQYMQMIKEKTVDFFILHLKLMQLFSNNKKDYTRCITLLGLYYQIYNDYKNLTLDCYQGSKGYCDDIKEGKYSLPVIHAISKSSFDPKIKSILSQRTKNVEMKKYFMTVIEESGSLEYTKNKLEELRVEIKAELKKLGGNPVFEEFMQSFSS